MGLKEIMWGLLKGKLILLSLILVSCKINNDYPDLEYCLMDNSITKEQNIAVCCKDITYSNNGVNLHGCNGKYNEIMNALNIIVRKK